MSEVKIKQFKNNNGEPVAGLTPEYAVYDKNTGKRLDSKLGDLQSKITELDNDGPEVKTYDVETKSWTNVFVDFITPGCVIKSIKLNGETYNSTVFIYFDGGSAQINTATNPLPFKIGSKPIERYQIAHSGILTFEIETQGQDGKIQLVNKEIISLNDRVEIVEEALGTVGNNVESTSNVSGYITANGSIGSLSSMRVYLFPCEPNKIYYLSSSLKTGASRWYAIYSSNVPSADTALKVGEAVTTLRDDVVAIKTPDKAAYIGITYFNNSTYSVHESKFVDTGAMEEKVNALDAVAKGLQHNCVEYDGNNLLIAHIYGGKEYTFWFRKCLFNELFTFYRVGYRNASEKADTNGIKEGVGITLINNASSDNIGPLSFYPGGWVGGNHSWKDDNVTKTAKTDSYEIHADGQLLTANTKMYCKDVVVEVHNSIYDPTIAPDTGATILPSKIIESCETYRISGSSIQVSSRNIFVKNGTSNIAAYYGMQSMFENETHVMTPLGAYKDWTPIASVASFNKSDYPSFNRFIEKKDGCYQASYLIPERLGNHQKANGEIFHRGTGKDYHYLVNTPSAILSNSGNTFGWSGVYTFFCEPIIDNEEVFAYRGKINGIDAIFVNVKKAFVGRVPIPADVCLKTISIVEKSDSITMDEAFTDSYIEMSATSEGSLIFKVE